jgi:hypothetical protein
MNIGDKSGELCPDLLGTITVNKTQMHHTVQSLQVFKQNLMVLIK